MPVSLQEKLDAQKKQLVAMAPKEAIEVMQRATEDLLKSGIMDKVKTTGEKSPDFTLNNFNGEPVTLSLKASEGPVIMGFYRGGW